jgi:hypothetical protein
MPLYQGCPPRLCIMGEVVMNSFRLIRRLAVIVTGLAGAMLASCGAVPPAFAGVAVPLGGDPHGRPGLTSPQTGPPGLNKNPPLPAHAHALATGGLPGWQMALIATGAALLVIAVAVIVYRTRAARRRVTVSAA